MGDDTTSSWSVISDLPDVMVISPVGTNIPSHFIYAKQVQYVVKIGTNPWKSSAQFIIRLHRNTLVKHKLCGFLLFYSISILFSYHT